MSKNILAIVAAAVVLGVWTITAMAALLTHDYTGVSIVTPPMMAAVGYMFFTGVLKRHNGDGRE
jgi:hypothetical protein